MKTYNQLVISHKIIKKKNKLTFYNKKILLNYLKINKQPENFCIAKSYGINNNYKNLNIWWNSKKIRKIKKEFCDKYSKSYKKVVLNNLKKFSYELQK